MLHGILYVVEKSLTFMFLLFLSGSLILAFRYSLFFPTCLPASRLTVFRLFTLLLFGSCNHCTFNLLSRKPENCEHYSSNHSLCCLHLCRPRLSLDETCISSSLFSQNLIISSPSCKLSKRAYFFEIWVWYYSKTSVSLSFMRLNLSRSNISAACLFSYSLSLTFVAAK